MDNYRINKVKVKENYKLTCEFVNGVKKEYDVKILMKKYKIFKKLKKSKELFSKVDVDCGGYGISWNEEIDIASEEIWNKGKIV